MANDPRDGMRDEFLAEAQEIIEALSRDLLVLDQSHKDGEVGPDLINEVFRAVHTLKGIAGMFGYHRARRGGPRARGPPRRPAARPGRCSAEEVLDVLFEGRRELSAPDLSGRAKQHGGCQRSSATQRRSSRSLARGMTRRSLRPIRSPAYALDQSVLARFSPSTKSTGFRTNVDAGADALYQLRVRFSLTSIDSSLEDLKTSRQAGRGDHHLPPFSMDGGDGDQHRPRRPPRHRALG